MGPLRPLWDIGKLAMFGHFWPQKGHYDKGLPKRGGGPKFGKNSQIISFFFLRAYLRPMFLPIFVLIVLHGYKERWVFGDHITISKVFMVCDSALAKDVEPRFEIHDHQGRHLQDKDDLLTQPRLAGGQQV